MLFITGGTGFIGSKLVRHLVRNHHRLLCVYRNNTHYDRVNDIADQIQWVKNDQKEIQKAFYDNSIDGVVHLATSYGRGKDSLFETMDCNVSLPLFLLKCANESGSRFFINTDTFFTRGLINGWEKNNYVYMNSYTKTKYMFREIVREEMKELNLAFINAQLQHVYGEDDGEGKFVLFLLEQLKNNASFVELSDGLQGRDWIYVDDVIDAYMALIANAAQWKPGMFYEFEVGTGIETTLKEFCLMMKEESGANTELLFGKRKMENNELEHSVADVTALGKLGWEPKVMLKEGIRRLLEE